MPAILMPETPKRIPDALMLAEDRKRGARMIDRVASIADIAEPLLRWTAPAASGRTSGSGQRKALHIEVDRRHHPLPEGSREMANPAITGRSRRTARSSAISSRIVLRQRPVVHGPLFDRPNVRGLSKPESGTHTTAPHWTLRRASIRLRFDGMRGYPANPPSRCLPKTGSLL